MTVTEPGLPRCVGVTCSRDGRQHQIPDEVLATELARGSGRLPALCGGYVVAASMTTPPGPPCPLCTATRGLTGHGSAS